MSDIFEKFDSMFDLEGLKKDLKEIEKVEKKEFKEIPLGDYEVKVIKMELKESKSGKPMIATQFKIIAGEYENSRIFMNQVLSHSFHFKIVNEFLNALKSSKIVEFKSFGQYADLITNIEIEIEEKEYALNYGDNKGFKTFKIIDVFK